MSALSDPSGTLAPHHFPLRSSFRWVVFGVVSLTCFAQYFVYDSLTPLLPILRQQLGLTSVQYGLVSSAYSVANVFLLMLLFAGVLVDRLGIRFSGILYSVICIVGTTLTTIGVLSSHIWLMAAGRLVFGLGAEALIVVNNKVMGRWFSGKELSTAFGLNLTILRAGSLLAGVTLAPLASLLGLTSTLLIPINIMMFGLTMFVIYLLLERIAWRRPGAPVAPLGAVKAPAAEGRFRLSEVFSFSRSFWFTALLCGSFYAAIFPFLNFAPDMMVQKFGYTPARAGLVSYSLIIGTMVAMPLLGWLLDRRPALRGTLIIAGACILTLSFLCLGFTRMSPIAPLFFLGVALALVPSALWSSLPNQIPQERLGTAYGLLGWVQNVGLFAFPLLAGIALEAGTRTTSLDGVEQTHAHYEPMMLMFAALGGVAFVAAIAYQAILTPKAASAHDAGLCLKTEPPAPSP